MTPDINRDASSLIPIPRRPSLDGHASSSETVIRDAGPDDDMDHSKEIEDMSPLLEKRTPLLQLLAPPRVSVDDVGNVSVWTPSPSGDMGMTKVWIPRSAWVKAIKSSILVVKVCSHVQPAYYPSLNNFFRS